MTALTYSDEFLRDILRQSKTIAVIGASTNWNRPSFFAMKYIQAKGYRTIPVNPNAVGEEILGEKVFASLCDIDVPIDIANVFRKPAEAMAIAVDAVAIGAKVLWMQLGVINHDAAETAERAGLKVVMDRCIKLEYGRLTGELSWGGMNSGLISNKKSRSLKR